jgi:PAS domain-containing protein
MSDSFKRRRRRSGSTSHRYPAALPVPQDGRRRRRIGGMEIAATAAVSCVAAALIGLVWMVTFRVIADQRAQLRDTAERQLSGQAATLAQEIGHELLLVDQSLSILQAAWKANSNAVDLAQWKRTMPALLAIADDIFIADDKQIIVQDVLPQAIGQGVGSAYLTFPHGALEVLDSAGGKSGDESQLIQQNGGAPVDARHFLMYVVRPLVYPLGWLVGASYRSENLAKFFAQASLGTNALVALVDTQRGQVQAVVGPSARRPTTDLSKTTLYDVMNRSDAGTWLGESGIDGVVRLHAFHHVAGRDMVVVAAATAAEVMAPAETLTAAARTVAVIASALVVAIAGLFAWGFTTLRASRRRHREMTRDSVELERLRVDGGTNLARLQLQAARLEMLLNNGSDGVALLDSGLRLVQWNSHFTRGIGVDLREALPLDALLREQAALGLFDSVQDIEATIAARVVLLQTGNGSVRQLGLDGQELFLRGLPIAEGGSILLLTGSAAAAPRPAPAAEHLSRGAGAAVEVAVPAPIEW